jgi:threonine dehydratase
MAGEATTGEAIGVGPSPSIADVLAARKRIAPYLRPTPLYRYPALSRLIGADTWVKHENHQPVGAFKVRGGVNLVSQMGDDERERGIIAASTGNHGQSLAYASRLFGVRATICAPADANPLKVQAMRDLGAELVLEGRDYDEARRRCEGLAERDGLRYVHSGNEPLLIAGVGTHTMELIEEQPDVDDVIVPIGGGSGAAGACIAGKALKPGLRVIGVQSERSPAAHRSWRNRRLTEAPNVTFAEGLATGTAFELPQRILWELLDEFVLVSDEEIKEAMAAMITGTRNLVEAAGAAPLAAAVKLRPRLQGRTIALICSGGNVSPRDLREVSARLPG